MTGALADTASGQQALFASPGTARRASVAAAARKLSRLITKLAALATAATVTKRPSAAAPPQASPLVVDTGASGA